VSADCWTEGELYEGLWFEGDVQEPETDGELYEASTFEGEMC